MATSEPNESVSVTVESDLDVAVGTEAEISSITTLHGNGGMVTEGGVSRAEKTITISFLQMPVADRRCVFAFPAGNGWGGSKHSVPDTKDR